MQINGEESDVKELVEAYAISVPSIRVFTRGVMADYRGPYDATGIAAYLREDSQVRNQELLQLVVRNP
jgi:hypothetical protein